MKSQIQVRGTEGYAEATQKFIDATIALNFFDLHRVL